MSLWILYIYIINYVHIYICMYMYMYMYICIYVYVYIYVCICICIYVYVYMYMYIYICICIYVYVNVYVYVYMARGWFRTSPFQHVYITITSILKKVMSLLACRLKQSGHSFDLGAAQTLLSVKASNIFCLMSAFMQLIAIVSALILCCIHA